MLDAAEEAIGFAQGRERRDLDQDRKLTLALVKDVETVKKDLPQLAEKLRDIVGRE